MWFEGNYRRIFLDMHIDDWNDEFMSNVDPKGLVELLKNAGAQQIVVKCRPHTGLAHYPTKIGRMHKGLRGRDYVGEMIELCHSSNIAVKAYFSQIFDNWAYENHPEWRMINGYGKTSREEADPASDFMSRKGRYGIVCPNNEEYRAYVKACLTEMTEMYDFETIFLDMPFFPEVCYCPSCRRKYFEQTGREMPRVIDWGDPAFREWQSIREEWMGDFAAFSTNVIKSIKPQVTIEHNLSMMADPWEYAHTDLVAEASDYVGGDLYGGFMQQTYMCKYYRNLSKALPFVFISSRCDPGLSYHTTTKTEEEFMLHTIIALAHNGAFSICDGANPDGTLCEEVYTGPVKNVFDESRHYEKYVSGDMLTNISVWFPSRSKCSWSDNGNPVTGEKCNKSFMDTHINMGRILREENLPFDVIPSKKLKGLESDALVICDAAVIHDEEMEDIEEYVRGGGNIYLSGHVGHERLLELLEAEYQGLTEHNVTYMSSTEAGKEYFGEFAKKSPMNVQSKMEILDFKGDYETLATLTLPYTMTGKCEFSSIHSNPPGIYTDRPVAVRKRVGEGQILWFAAPIENSRPYMSRRAVGRILKSLCKDLEFESNAPSFVEILGWKKDNKRYYAAINEQETSPVAPMFHIEIKIPGEISKATIAEKNTELKITREDGRTTIYLPELKLFSVIEIEE